MRSTFLGFFILSTLALKAAGQPATVEFVEKKGDPYQLRFSDGRVATLMINRKPIIRLPMGFQVFDNTCSDAVNNTGRYLLGLKIDQFAVRWTKHPDRAKLGKDVIAKSHAASGGSFGINDISVLTGADKALKPRLAGGIPQDELEGDDFVWLPGAPKTAPDSVFLVRWDTEAMRPNPETGLLENRTVSVLQRVSLKKTAPQRMAIATASHNISGTLSLFQGDMWAWVLQTTDGFCLISLKTNLAAAGQEVLKYFYMPGTYEPYIFGSDEYSDVAFPNLLGSVKKDPSQWEFE